MDVGTFIRKLSEYETRLSVVQTNVRTTPHGNSYLDQHAAEDLAQLTHELIDLFTDVFGENDYAKKIARFWRRGDAVWRVGQILAIVRAAHTRFSERPETFGSTAETHRPASTFSSNGTKIFIGHGKSLVWRELKDFIADRLNLSYDEFNAQSAAGMHTIQRLSQMMNDAKFAFLILTAEDELADGAKQARMNVVHEVGLFQGRLGFERAILLVEEGCQQFSNVHGLTHISFPPQKISAVFEEVRRVLEREKITVVAFQEQNTSAVPPSELPDDISQAVPNLRVAEMPAVIQLFRGRDADKLMPLLEAEKITAWARPMNPAELPLTKIPGTVWSTHYFLFTPKVPAQFARDQTFIKTNLHHETIYYDLHLNSTQVVRVWPHVFKK
jgi:predicted nucleotide-binding protein